MSDCRSGVDQLDAELHLCLAELGASTTDSTLTRIDTSWWRFGSFIAKTGTRSLGDVTAAMARLGVRDQEILQLHLWEGLAPREIAEVLALTTVVVRPRLSRARARLREALGNDPHPPGHLPSSSVPSGTVQPSRKEW